MTWKYKEKELEVKVEEDMEETEEVLPLEAATNLGRTGYVALTGLTFDKYNIRVEIGEDVPPEVLEDDLVFEWLRGKRGAIKLK